MQDKGGEGAKELEEFQSGRMKVVQLDVCSEEQVNQAAEYIKENLEDSERGAVINSHVSTNLDKRRSVCMCSFTDLFSFLTNLSLVMIQVCGLW